MIYIFQQGVFYLQKIFLNVNHGGIEVKFAWQNLNLKIV